MLENRQTGTKERGTTHCSACGAVSRRDDATFCLVCGKLLGEEYLPLDNLRASYGLHRKSIAVEADEITELFAQKKNGTAMSAQACLVYSTVPYLGILFVPLTILIGLLAVGISARKPELNGRATAFKSIALSIPVAFVQIFLWWLLYKIPETRIPM